MNKDERDLIVINDDNNNDVTTSKVTWWRKYAGLMFCVAFTIAMATTTTVVKLVDLPATEKVFGRCCTQFILILPIITYNKFPVIQPHRSTFLLLIYRGISSSAASLLLYNALQRIPIGDATAISFCSAIFAGLFSRVFLREAYTLTDGALALVSIGGVCLIAQPQFLVGGATGSPDQTVGIAYALCSAVAIGSSLTAIRGLAKVEPWVGVFYYCTFGSLLNGAVFYVEGDYVMPCYDQLHLFFGIGLLGTASQFLITKSLQYERSSTVAVMRSIEIIIVYVIQTLLFGETPNVFSICGASLIFLSAIGIGVRKYFKNTSTQADPLLTKTD